jgi:hypothetical protein
MESQFEILTDAVDQLANDESITGKISLLERISWEINKYLTPASLELMEGRLIRELFYSILENYLTSLASGKVITEISGSIDGLSNRPVGGRWI